MFAARTVGCLSLLIYAAVSALVAVPRKAESFETNESLQIFSVLVYCPTCTDTSLTRPFPLSLSKMLRLILVRVASLC
jgi:hypothetical protein